MKGLLPEAVGRRLDPGQRYGLRVTLFGVALVLVAIPFAILVIEVLRQGPLVRVDRSAAEGLHDWVRRSTVAVTLLQAVSFLGKPIWFFLLVGPVAVFLLRRGRVRLTLFLVVTGLGGGLVDTAVKEAVSRPRPSLVDPVATAYGKSFPSGHAMTSTVVYGALLLVFLPVVARRWRKPVVGALVLLVLSIGFSRLALGVHYLSDVVGGYVLGLAWLSASVAAFSIWREELGREPVEPLEGLEPEAAPDLSAP